MSLNTFQVKNETQISGLLAFSPFHVTCCLQLYTSRYMQKSAYCKRTPYTDISYLCVQAIYQICLVISQYVEELLWEEKIETHILLGRGRKWVSIFLRPICDWSSSCICVYFTAFIVHSMSKKDNVFLYFYSHTYKKGKPHSRTP